MMFKNDYQGGTFFEVFTVHGKDSIKQLKITGKACYTYSKLVKSYVLSLENSSLPARISFPKDSKTTLHLVQKFLAIQLAWSDLFDLSVEIGITDSSQAKRRIILSCAIKDVSVTLLHARLPLSIGDAKPPLNLYVDLESLVSFCWSRLNKPSVRCVDHLSIGGICQIKRIFTMKNKPMSQNRDDLNDSAISVEISMPKQLQLAPDISVSSLTISKSRNETEKQLPNNPAKSRPSADHQQTSKAYHIAFGRKTHGSEYATTSQSSSLTLAGSSKPPISQVFPTTSCESPTPSVIPIVSTTDLEVSGRSLAGISDEGTGCTTSKTNCFEDSGSSSSSDAFHCDSLRTITRNSTFSVAMPKSRQPEDVSGEVNNRISKETNRPIQPSFKDQSGAPSSHGPNDYSSQVSVPGLHEQIQQLSDKYFNMNVKSESVDENTTDLAYTFFSGPHSVRCKSGRTTSSPPPIVTPTSNLESADPKTMRRSTALSDADFNQSLSASTKHFSSVKTPEDALDQLIVQSNNEENVWDIQTRKSIENISDCVRAAPVNLSNYYLLSQTDLLDEEDNDFSEGTESRTKKLDCHDPLSVTQDIDLSHLSGPVNLSTSRSSQDSNTQQSTPHSTPEPSCGTPMTSVSKSVVKRSVSSQAVGSTDSRTSQSLRPFDTNKYKLASDSFEQIMLMKLHEQQQKELQEECKAEIAHENDEQFIRQQAADVTQHLYDNNNESLRSTVASTIDEHLPEFREDISALSSVRDPKHGTLAHYSDEMRLQPSRLSADLRSSNPREWSNLTSPPILENSRSSLLCQPSNEYKGKLIVKQDLLTGLKSTTQPEAPRDIKSDSHIPSTVGLQHPVGAILEEMAPPELDLAYDPCLNCYYDPESQKYYELV